MVRIAVADSGVNRGARLPSRARPSATVTTMLVVVVVEDLT
jgi:hypothetical protein